MTREVWPGVQTGFPDTPFYWATPLPWLRNVRCRARERRSVFEDVVQSCHPESPVEQDLNGVVRCNACKRVIGADVKGVPHA